MVSGIARVIGVFGATVALALFAAAGAGAVSIQRIDEFSAPTFVSSDPSDPDRLLVTERLGTVQLVEGPVKTTFLDIRTLVGCPVEGCAGERGLMSVAPAPDFGETGVFYVFYGQEGSGDLKVDEFTANGDHALASTRRPVISIPHPDAPNHNGGQLQFGPEGNLFISTGDGGGGNDQYLQAQNLSTALGKILRIDPTPPAGGPGYAVPPGNPYPTAAPPADAIWSYGLRNPFRFSFDQLSGDLIIGDVGQAKREEVDYAPAAAPGQAGGAGDNYGWACREGLIQGPGGSLPEEGCTTGTFVDPVFEYSSEGNEGPCSIIGGYVARDESLGGLYGRYVYADLCAGDIRSLLLPASVPGSASGDRSEGIAPSGMAISFGEDSCGRLYVVIGTTVSRLIGATPAVCPPPAEAPLPGEDPGGGPGAPPTADEAPAPATPAETKLLSTLPAEPIVTSVRLKAEDDAVAPGRRVEITIQVLPCNGREGHRVRLLRGGRKAGSAKLNGRCVATFHPRVHRRSTFRARVPAVGRYLPARSTRLTISAD